MEGGGGGGRGGGGGGGRGRGGGGGGGGEEEEEEEDVKHSIAHAKPSKERPVVQLIDNHDLDLSIQEIE